MARANNRTGYGKNRGSINPPIHFGSAAPDSPSANHLWVDTTNVVIKWWNGSNWITLDNAP